MITIPRATLEKMGEALVALQREQILAGLNRDGQRFPVGVDLIQTGLLLRSLRYQIEGQEILLESPVAYAAVLDARYRWFGLCPEYQKKLEAAWEPLLAEGAVYKEVA